MITVPKQDLAEIQFLYSLALDAGSVPIINKELNIMGWWSKVYFRSTPSISFKILLIPIQIVTISIIPIHSTYNNNLVLDP